MNNTPRGSRLHIAIFGRRNVGKSSLINSLTNQDLAIVSDVAGTTTDPVFKSMEILPIGPVVLIDTAGIDDQGMLGELRRKKTLEVLRKTDLVLLVVSPENEPGNYETDIAQLASENGVPVVGVANKQDLDLDPKVEDWQRSLDIPFYLVSSVTRYGLQELKQGIVKHAPKDWTAPAIIGDKLSAGDTVIMVIPIDNAAPKGRIILPQVQTLRDLLDHNTQAMVCKETELAASLEKMSSPPRMVITDSQAFKMVSEIVPESIELTSFSILFARYKGDLETLVAGAKAIDELQPGTKVLVAEACTHHRVDDDIGTQKIPHWLEQKVGGKLNFTWANGINLPENLNQFDLVVHCGACMINRQEMMYRVMECKKAQIPIVNYGVLIAHIHGILPRVLSPFPEALEILHQTPYQPKAGSDNRVEEL
ncbi:MAG: [FeFe] hydrogenase H-cluster maturation GTPase HydF [Firmicutes bacterium]|nr:[FeFe] hydrogenase H-cluster maturation GTPase HydF [Bacillota bacterium]